MAKKVESLLGQKFGMLEVVGTTRNAQNRPAYVCACECGNTVAVVHSNLKRGQISCGCICRNDKYHTDISGTFIDEWWVVKPDPDVPKNYICLCSCGTLASVSRYVLINPHPHAKTCGCRGTIGHLLGKKIGRLTVVGVSGSKSARGGTLVDCICECGTVRTRIPSQLSNTTFDSCGCYKGTTGPEHFNYNPNKADSERYDRRQYPEYVKWRRAVHARDNYMCLLCGADKSLEAHHLLSYTRYPYLRTHEPNGVTLCTSCHNEFHKKFGRKTFRSVDFTTFKLIKLGELNRFMSGGIRERMYMQQRDIDKLYSDFIAKRTYARWIEDEKRRESWSDSVTRYYNFLESRVPESLKEDFEKARTFTLELGSMPSMRGLWSAGPALDENNIAMFNCAFVTMDEKEKFGEMLYILMHGTGMGFSVERQFVVLLPEVPADFVRKEEVHQVADSKLGWKLAYDHCINSLFAGELPVFDYSLVRPKGARLKTFGGRASGPEPLKQLIDYTIRMVKGAAGRKLNSLEVHDICCMIANCVVVGGVETQI